MCGAVASEWSAHVSRGMVNIFHYDQLFCEIPVNSAMRLFTELKNARDNNRRRSFESDIMEAG